MPTPCGMCGRIVYEPDACPGCNVERLADLSNRLKSVKAAPEYRGNGSMYSMVVLGLEHAYRDCIARAWLYAAWDGAL